jgi:hypothetical protein
MYIASQSVLVAKYIDITNITRVDLIRSLGIRISVSC